MIIERHSGAVRSRLLGWVILGSAVMVVLTVGVAFAVWLTWPHAVVVNADTHSTGTPGVFTQSYWVKNTGGSSFTIDSVNTSESVVRTIGTNVRKPITVPEGRVARIVMTYRVTDCQHPPEVLPVNLNVDRWWGTQTITVQDHGQGFDGAYVACVPVTR